MYRCKGVVRPNLKHPRAALRCYFNVQEGSDYCPGHQEDPEGACDYEAVGRYQAEHGVDYPCGKPEDTVRLFNTCPTCGVRLTGDGSEEHTEECYRLGGIDAHFIAGGVPEPLTEERIARDLETLDRALAGVGMNDYLAGTDPIERLDGCDEGQSADCCPLGRCYYEEQLARRGRVELALTPNAWRAQLAIKKKKSKKPRSLD